MKVRVPEYYDRFECIASECTDTCCAGWQVDVDDNSYEYYRTITGEFGDRLHSVMIDGTKGSEGQFRIQPDGRCPFLNECGLCDLYAELGEDALCVTCDQYPRFTAEFGALREKGISLSCKTAAELILESVKEHKFVEFEDRESFPSLNDIDGQLYIRLMEARQYAFEIMQKREYSVWERMTVLIQYAEYLQNNIKKLSRDNVKYKFNISKTEQISAKNEINLYKKIWKYYLSQVIIKKEWPMLYTQVNENLYNADYAETKQAFLKYYKEREYEYENIMIYFIYRYFMQAVFDRDVLTKAKTGIIGTLLIRQCDMGRWAANKGTLTFEEQVDIVHLYSREVEHSEENFANLARIFKKKNTFSVNNIIELLK